MIVHSRLSTSGFAERSGASGRTTAPKSCASGLLARFVGSSFVLPFRRSLGGSLETWWDTPFFFTVLAMTHLLLATDTLSVTASRWFNRNEERGSELKGK